MWKMFLFLISTEVSNILENSELWQLMFTINECLLAIHEVFSRNIQEPLKCGFQNFKFSL